MEILNRLIGAVALLMLGAQLLRISTAAYRQRRAGAPGPVVGAALTAHLIGLGLALAGAVGGGYLIFTALEPLALPEAIHLIAQVIVALLGSWLAARCYSAWLVQPVYHWFAGEEGAGHDR